MLVVPVRADGGSAGCDDARFLLRLEPKAVADDVTQGCHGTVRDLVVGGGAGLAAANDARLVEDAEVLGDVRLPGRQRFDDLADVHLAVVEQDPEYGQTGAVTKHAE